jgi:hypothetical protein
MAKFLFAGWRPCASNSYIGPTALPGNGSIELPELEHAMVDVIRRTWTTYSRRHFAGGNAAPFEGRRGPPMKHRKD